VAPGGRLIALDLLPMEPLHGVEFIQGDFHDDDVLQAVRCARRPPGRPCFVGHGPQYVGYRVVDQARVMLLAELTLEFCAQHLKPGGDMLVKVFQGDGFMELRKRAAGAVPDPADEKAGGLAQSQCRDLPAGAEQKGLKQVVAVCRAWQSALE
jgi:23S rRNA U2552 (ribose-2'-O)-methylase RlmE/FtsJ